jgi:PKHD-type hydroxylase
MHAPTVPPAQFQLLAAAMGALTTEQMDQLIAHCDQVGGEGALSGGVELSSYRRSHVSWVKREQGFQWLYERIAALAQGFNSRFFGLELSGIEQALQVARYDAARQGGYDWHTDFGTAEQTRKLSISIQLSHGAAYAGGDLELDVSTEVTKAGRERGLAIAFPSFVRHRVAPVTAGVRYSLVAWVHGPRFR